MIKSMLILLKEQEKIRFKDIAPFFDVLIVELQNLFKSLVTRTNDGVRVLKFGDFAQYSNIIQLIKQLMRLKNFNRFLTQIDNRRQIYNCRTVFETFGQEPGFPERIGHLFSDWLGLIDLIRLNKNNLIKPKIFKKDAVYEFTLRMIDYYYCNRIRLRLIQSPANEKWAEMFARVATRPRPENIIKRLISPVLNHWKNAPFRGFITGFGILINQRNALMICGNKKDLQNCFIYVRKFNSACEASAIDLILDILNSLRSKKSLDYINYPEKLGIGSGKLINILSEIVPSFESITKKERRKFLKIIRTNTQKLLKSKHVQMEYVSNENLLIGVLDSKLYDKAINQAPIDDLHEEQIVSAILKGYTLPELCAAHLIYMILTQNQFSTTIHDVLSFTEKNKKSMFIQ